jgi:long-subunit acyl-CoA synthetase (AMP-forming)
MQIGTEVENKVLDKRQKGMAINQCATLVYTSGTTGMPKGNNKVFRL